MSVIFDGRGFAKQKEEIIKDKIRELATKGVPPKLVTIIVGNDPASHLYVNLKRKAVERVGAQVEILQFGMDSRTTRVLPSMKGRVRENDKEKLVNDLIHRIKDLNRDDKVHGIMVQLPLPDRLRGKTKEVVEAIDPKKDVDGLRENSPYLHPTSKAVIQIMGEAISMDSRLRGNDKGIAVVGASGMVGRPLVGELTSLGFEVDGLSSKSDNFEKRVKAADVVISATGVPNLIKNVKKGAVVIDVGSPKGDVNFEEVVDNASFITPVPGGVGPVTITCLLENLVEAAYTALPDGGA